MKKNHFISHSKALLKLTYPILIAQLIQNLMGFADIVMAGRVSSIDLAAVAIANSIWLPIVLTMYGLIMALAAIVAQLNGSKNFNKIIEQTYQTAWIALSMGIGIIFLYYLLAPIVKNNIEIEANLSPLIFDYLKYIVWGAPGYCLYLVLRNYTEGLSYTRPTMIISLIGLLINIPANYIFIYGKFGVPAFGGAGCGIATAIVYWVMLLSMLTYCYYSQVLKSISIFSRFYFPVIAEIKQIVLLGTPIALSLLFEVSLFTVVSLFLVPFGSQVVAGHQVALNYTSLIFMIPLSIAMSTTIKVGFSLGENNLAQAKNYTKYAVILGLIIASFTAIFTILFRTPVASIYSEDIAVIHLASNLMLLATIYQFSDTIQVISAGALRGYKDTKSILYITFISYWLVGLPVGIILGSTELIVESLGAYGFWIGFIVGLSTAAVLLAWRLKVIEKRFLLAHA